MSKDNNSDINNNFKQEIFSKLTETSQIIEKINNGPINQQYQKNFIQGLNNIDEILRNRIDYDFKLRFAIHGLNTKQIFSKMIHSVLSSPEKVNMLGKGLNQLPAEHLSTPLILKKGKNIEPTLRTEVRNITHHLFIKKIGFIQPGD